MTVVKHITEIRSTTLHTIIERRAGKIQSYKTPWPKMDNQMINGIDWGSLLVVGGISGVGKTALVDQIVNETNKNNPNQEIDVLKFQFEMTDEQTGVRELTGTLGLSMQQLYSADPNFKLEDWHIQNIEKFYESKKEDKIWQISDSQTARGFEAAIMEFYKNHKNPLIVYLDHSILVNKSADEASTLDTLINVCKVTAKLKKIIPVIFIILTQMNRSLDDTTRKENGRISNYPVKADIYGGDALYQFADVVMVVMRPGAMGIKFYGPEKYIVSRKHLAVHILKNRWNGESILFFEEDLQHFKIKEITPPERQIN